MGSRSLSNLCAVIFLVLGFLALGLRIQSRETLDRAENNSLWRLTYNYELECPDDISADSYVDIGLPRSTAYATLRGEPKYTYPPELDVEQRAPYGSGTQVVRVEATRAGKHLLNAAFEIMVSSRADGMSPSLEVHKLTADQRDDYLREEDGLPKMSGLVQRQVSRLPQGDEATDSQRIEILFDFCRSEISDAGNDPIFDDVAKVLSQDRKATKLGRARTFVTLCRAAGLPSRLVVGFDLKQSRDAKPHVWTEVYTSNRWVPFDPATGYSRGSLPRTYVPVRFGGDEGDVWYVPLRSAMQGVWATYSIELLSPPDALLKRAVRHPRQILDLTRLPLEMHQAMSLILLLPFGALITAIFRNIVGLKTFGTFAPALLAMSFIYANWSTGIVILAVVLSTGFTSRRFLERLRLLMVPRLSIVLTVIIMCIMFAVSILDYSGLTPSAQAVLLPMVILTTLTERYYVTSEEDGHTFAVKLSLGTLIVAAICYAVLSWNEVGRLILAYPEAHFITIAVLIYIGRYTGYRLSELIRFRDFVKPQET